MCFYTKGIVLNRGPLFKRWTLLIPRPTLFQRLTLDFRPRCFYFWLGRKDSNLWNARFRAWCLTTWRRPNTMAGVVGFEPTECRSQSPVPYRLAIPQYLQDTIFVASPIKLFSKFLAGKTGLEPAIHKSVICCMCLSLSYINIISYFFKKIKFFFFTLGYRQAVRHRTLTPAFRRFESFYPSHICTCSSVGRALDF